jgi:hypothetical protein
MRPVDRWTWERLKARSGMSGCREERVLGKQRANILQKN